jgi:hypothetical protein
MCNKFLVVAYILLWGIFMAYSWVIHARQTRLQREVEELKRELERQTSS